MLWTHPESQIHALEIEPANGASAHQESHKAPRTKWEERAKTMKLLQSCTLGVGRKIVALALLALTFSAKHDLLVRCNVENNPMFGKYVCQLCKSHLRAFPRLATAASLFLGMRRILQKRIYFGLLKHGGLLHFTQKKIWRDPLSCILITTVVLGLGNFVFKVYCNSTCTITGVDSACIYYTIEVLNNHITWICFIFFVFYRRLTDIEGSLLSLNDFLTKDNKFESMKHFMMELKELDEERVRHVVLTTDFHRLFGQHNGTSRLQGIYRHILTCHSQDQASFPVPVGCTSVGPSTHKGQSAPSLYQTMWPAKILYDPFLTDIDSIVFRRTFKTIHVSCIIIQAVFLASYLAWLRRAVVVHIWEKGKWDDTMEVVTIAWIVPVHVRLLTASMKGMRLHA